MSDPENMYSVPLDSEIQQRGGRGGGSDEAFLRNGTEEDLSNKEDEALLNFYPRSKLFSSLLIRLSVIIVTKH